MNMIIAMVIISVSVNEKSPTPKVLLPSKCDDVQCKEVTRLGQDMNVMTK